MIALSVLPSRSYPIQATEIVNDVCFRSSPLEGRWLIIYGVIILGWRGIVNLEGRNCLATYPLLIFVRRGFLLIGQYRCKIRCWLGSCCVLEADGSNEIL